MNIEHAGKSWEVFLGDDGSMDTLIKISANGHSITERYDSEYASQFRNKRGEMTTKGLKELAVEAIEQMDDYDWNNFWGEEFERDGFTFKGSKETGYRISCSQCQAAAVNGTPTHEHGCPNARREEPEDDFNDNPAPKMRPLCVCGHRYSEHVKFYRKGDELVPKLVQSDCRVALKASREHGMEEKCPCSGYVPMKTVTNPLTPKESRSIIDHAHADLMDAAATPRGPHREYLRGRVTGAATAHGRGTPSFEMDKEMEAVRLKANTLPNPMRMSREHYDFLKAAIVPLAPHIAAHREALKSDRRVKDLEKRLRWDLFWAAKNSETRQGRGWPDWYRGDYGYDDTHIDTALKRIVAEIETRPNPSNRNVATAFAQGATKGKGFGSVFIEGDTIYSYGKHFPIATRHEDTKVAYRNAARYSVTTSKHQGMVAGALGMAGYQVIDSDRVEGGKVLPPSEGFAREQAGRAYAEAARPAYRALRKSEKTRKAAGVSAEAWYKPAPRNNPGKIVWGPGRPYLHKGKTPNAACSECGGWTAFGGMSQFSKDKNPTKENLGRPGCSCSGAWKGGAGLPPGYVDMEDPSGSERTRLMRGWVSKGFGKKTHDNPLGRMKKVSPCPGCGGVKAREDDYGELFCADERCGRHRGHRGPWQPKTGRACSCRPGVQRDNCPACEGTGQVIDFAAIRARNLENPPRTLIGRKALDVKMTGGMCQGTFGACYGLPDGSAFVKGFFTKVPGGRCSYITYLDEAKAKREGQNSPDRPWKHDFSSLDVVAIRVKGGLLLKSKKGTPLWGMR